MLRINRKSCLAAAFATVFVSSSALAYKEDYSYGAGPAKETATAAPAVPPAVKFAGDLLTDSSGMTLYVFDKDRASAGRSVCNGECATSWPPLIASDAAKEVGDFGLAKRDDERRQWAYKGRPLYRWAGDRKAGDTTGDGVGGVWHKATR